MIQGRLSSCCRFYQFSVNLAEKCMCLLLLSKGSCRMPIYKFGYLVKAKREELGYTQEELADGICSVTTLSRIENGERMPTKDHFILLLQRLGYSDAMSDCCVDEKTFLKHELRCKIYQAIFGDKREIAKQLFNDYQKNTNKATPIEQQFILLVQTLLFPEMFTGQSKLDLLHTAMRITCPKYNGIKFPLLLSYEEILILNCIAECYFEEGNSDYAISILFRLKQYYEMKAVNPEEVQRTQPIILYNLAKYLGHVERYDECIEICNMSIRIARETGQCRLLGKIFYTKARVLMQRCVPGDVDSAKESAKFALYIARIMGHMDSIRRYTHFISSTFHDDMLL